MVSKAKKQSLKSKKFLEDIDVTKLEHVDQLVENIKNNVVTLLLIYADWCGHCGTFKEEIWKKLAATKGRKIGMAKINEKMLAHTPFANMKIDGYPTTALTGSDMKLANFKGENEDSTNAMPNTRDLPRMTKLVTADPNQVMADNSMNNDTEEATSATPTPKAENARNNDGDEVMENIKNGNAIEASSASDTTPNPPNVEDDLIASQEFVPTPKKPNSNTAVGGSLYESLVTYAGKRTRRSKPRRKTTKKAKRK